MKKILIFTLLCFYASSCSMFRFDTSDVTTARQNKILCKLSTKKMNLLVSAKQGGSVLSIQDKQGREYLLSKSPRQTTPLGIVDCFPNITPWKRHPQYGDFHKTNARFTAGVNVVVMSNKNKDQDYLIRKTVSITGYNKFKIIYHIKNKSEQKINYTWSGLINIPFTDITSIRSQNLRRDNGLGSSVICKYKDGRQMTISFPWQYSLYNKTQNNATTLQISRGSFQSPESIPYGQKFEIKPGHRLSWFIEIEIK